MAQDSNGLFGPGVFGSGIDLSALDADTAFRLGEFMGEQMSAARDEGIREGRSRVISALGQMPSALMTPRQIIDLLNVTADWMVES